MSDLVALLVELGRYRQANPREIEFELALAQRVTVHTRRGHINWCRHFPWLKNILSEAQHHRCCWCGKRMDPNGHKDDRPTLEHAIPLSRGGEDTPANIVIACCSCNQQRGNADVPPSARQADCSWSVPPLQCDA